MVAVVIPFRAGGKSRLPGELREGLALAMLGDVVEAATSCFPDVRVVTDGEEAMIAAAALGAVAVADPGRGQGAAVTAALVGLCGQCLVVNADLPCASPAALRDLAARGSAHVPARDGTTNALSLVAPELFEPLYGAGSAARFAAAGFAVASIPELEQDVDLLADLELLTRPVGPRTSAVLNRHELARAPRR